MADPTPKFIQFFVKLFDNKTLTLQFPPSQTLTLQSITHQIQTLTQIPTSCQTLTLNGKLLSDSTTISPKSLSLTTLHLAVPFLGGKGGFGSLLRGAATKAGQKKTNNFDACRDMSGRRLRHVNAEKRLEEWRAEEEERRMERVAEEYLKKMVKKGKKKGDGAEAYVERYREESRRCVQEVERSVRESVEGIMLNKRKKSGNGGAGDNVEENGDAKKLKIWMGKRKLGESDSDDSDTDKENSDSDAENEKSVVINNGNQSDSSKDASFGSVSVPQSDRDLHNGGSSDSGSEEEKETLTAGSTGSAGSPSASNGPADMSSAAGEKSVDLTEQPSVSADVVPSSAEAVVEQHPSEPESRDTIANGSEPSISSLIEQEGPPSTAAVPEVDGSSEPKSTSPENGVTGPLNDLEVLQPLNFDDINSAVELEVLGMERLKSELQTRGLKCGGTLQERAARLFLLKTTPIEKLPKKLLAKK